MRQKIRKLLESDKKLCDKIFYLILVLSALFRIIFFNHFNRIWWDSGVYVGIAKYLFSAGELGIFEQIRPLLFPFILGFFWKLGLDPVFIGKLISLVASILCIFLTYKIAEVIFDRRTAILSALFMAISPTFAFFGFKPLTDVLSLCFGLAAICFFVKKRHALTGIFCALAFLTRLTLGLFFGIMMIAACSSILFYLIRKKRRNLFKEIKNTIIFIVFFVIFISPYFIYSYIKTGSFLGFMRSASAIIHHVGLSINEPWHYYFRTLFFENFLVLFAIVGAIVLAASILRSIKTNNYRHFSANINYLLILLLVFIPLLYHSSLARKEIRYILIFLPFLIILTSKGMIYFYSYLRVRRAQMWMKKAFYVAIFLLIFTSMAFLFIYYEEPFSKQELAELEAYRSHIGGTENILSSGPNLLLYFDDVRPIYSFETEHYEMRAWFDNIYYFSDNQTEIPAEHKQVAVDTCEFYCTPSDDICSENKDRFMKLLTQDYVQKFYTQIGFCEYYIFIKDKRD